MALFKVFRGQRNDLDTVTKVDGHAYFCTDDGSFWIDYKDGDGEIQRKELNANNAKTLTGKSLEEIETEFQNNLQISGTVTKDIGGISKDTVYNNARVIDVLSELLFPYVPFTFNSISTITSAGNKEYGTSVTVSKVTPSFTKGSKDITSVKIGTTSGGNNLYEGTSATHNTAITLTTSQTYNGVTGGIIYCTLSDGVNSVTKSASIAYVYHNYVIVTTSTAAPTSKGSGRNLGTSVEADKLETTDNSYIWFLMPNQNKKQIQEYAMNQWNNVNTTPAGSVTFTTDTGKALTYYAYRTDKMMSNTSKYRIN